MTYECPSTSQAASSKKLTQLIVQKYYEMKLPIKLTS